MELQAQLQLIQNVKEEWKDDECIKQIAEVVKNTKENLSKAFRDSLDRLSIFQPKETIVEKVLKGFPECMKVKNELDIFPIQSCLFQVTNKGKSLKYIPVLAKEGLEREIGGADKRGGLLTRVKTLYGNLNILQYLAFLPGENYDRLAVNTMEELKKLGLLKKDDIRKKNLAFISARFGKEAELRFRFLLEWDPAFPKARRTIRETGVIQPPFMCHLISKHKKLENVKANLIVTMDMYPEEAGLLFQKYDGTTALEYAFEKFGEKETMAMLHEILSPTKSIPILHHALVYIPQKDKLFTKWFPWAFHLRDHHGRSLHQAIMAAGGKCIEESTTIIASMSDDQVQEKDPITTLYPFAAVASGEDGDLERSFELLRRQPGVLDRNPVQRNLGRTKKRKRSSAI
ncbi:hypothetical protein CTEN210_02837 [Chaetoceros tenuissimus]|uniref:Uncharacterized protein n=1 Tax=Chaetoceros tenuissimus TaxID=426638 RepID=A0AAD3CIP5_9STRA|nr:hypothetical protein CTEN210_02837 [Chaetoceros tenuissimus]